MSHDSRSQSINGDDDVRPFSHNPLSPDSEVLSRSDTVAVERHAHDTNLSPPQKKDAMAPFPADAVSLKSAHLASPPRRVTVEPAATTASPSTMAPRGTEAGKAGDAAIHPAHPLPEDVVFRKNPDHDDMGYRALFEVFSNPQTIGSVRAAFRTAAFVTFPLFTIATHPNTMYKLGYPMLLVGAVVATSTHQGWLGMQIGIHTWLWRGVAYMLLFGTILDTWSIQHHDGAWYGMVALGIFLAGLVGHGLMRRFMYLYFFIYILMIKTLGTFYPQIPINTASWLTADILIGSMIGMAALCFPYPLLTKSLIDMIMAKLFEGFGKMFMGMITFAWMPDAHASCLFFADSSPFIKIESTLDMMAPLLWFTNWEPTEFALHNPIRLLKLSLVRRIIALTYAAFGAGRATVEMKRQQAERKAMQAIRITLFQAAHAKYGKYLTNGGGGAHAMGIAHLSTETSTASFLPSTAAILQEHPDGAFTTDEAEAPRDPHVEHAEKCTAALRKNTQSCVKAFALALMQTMTLLGSSANTPEKMLEKVPFDDLREKMTTMRRNQRLELVQVMRIQRALIERRMVENRQKKSEEAQKETQTPAHKAGEAEEADEEHLRVKDSNSPYGRTHYYTIGRDDVVRILESRGIIEESEVYIRLSDLYFHGLMAMIAGEILNFGEQMKDYKPSMSLGRRLFNFFIVEPWNDFWEELWCRVSFARPSDYRTIKDAIRMTCAYLSATAMNLELYTVPGGTYYFGTTLLLGLPVEEESLGMSINRLAGNAIGCSLGFMAYHNTNNFAQRTAMLMCFVFALRCAKDHPLYGQTFMYAAAITLAASLTTANTLQLLTRLIASSYTVVAYTLCCMFIFPNNSIKTCWGYRCKLTKVMSEIIDDVVVTLSIPPDCHNAALADGQEGREDKEDDNGERGPHHEPVSYPQSNTEAMQMCSQLNIQMILAEKLLAMCDKWAPFAARQHVIRGMDAFPSAASTTVTFAHKRLVAHLRLLVFGAQLLHRPRTAPLVPEAARVLNGSIIEFFKEFAGCMRLVSQDFIDSLQESRKWSYPLTLSHTSQMGWMRVRLLAITFEIYMIAVHYMTHSTFEMKPADYQELRRAAEKRAQQARELHSTELRVHVGGEHGEAARGPAEGGADANAPYGTEGNMSFVDRFLDARRRGESILGDSVDAEALERLHTSIYLPQPREESAMVDAKGRLRPYIHHVRLHEPAVMPQDSFPFTQESAEAAVQKQLHKAAAAKVKQELKMHQHEKKKEAAAAVTASDLERTHKHEEHEEHEEEKKSNISDKSTTSSQRQQQREGENADAGSNAPPQVDEAYETFTPRKSKSRLSQLILIAEQGPEAFIPVYQGPAFNYTEDAMDTEKDTDFAAIMTILCSCYSIIYELEALTGPMNTISGYQKQLHESSLATGLIDRASEEITAYRQNIYNRYHHPDASVHERRPLHTQSDPFEDWRF